MSKNDSDIPVGPIHVFTSWEDGNVKVYDDCTCGVSSCKYERGEQITPLKPCRFAYLVSLGTAECKEAYQPLVSNVTDGFKVVDDNLKNYKLVYETVNEAKLDGIIGKELAEGYSKIVKDKPDCIYSMGAVPTLDGGIRPITDCSMPRDISVNNYCDDLIVDFQYKNEINGEKRST